MNQISNQSVAVLADIICKQLEENGFAISAIDRTNRYAGYLSAFMAENSLPVYEEFVGSRFLDTLSPRFSIETNNNANQELNNSEQRAAEMRPKT